MGRGGDPGRGTRWCVMLEGVEFCPRMSTSPEGLHRSLVCALFPPFRPIRLQRWPGSGYSTPRPARIAAPRTVLQTMHWKTTRVDAYIYSLSIIAGFRAK